MLAANRGSAGPGGSVRGSQPGENICMVDCAAPGTTVSPGPLLRSAGPDYTQKGVPGWAELDCGPDGLETVPQSRCSHVLSPRRTDRRYLRYR